MPCGSQRRSGPRALVRFQPVRARHALRHTACRLYRHDDGFNPCARVMPCGIEHFALEGIPCFNPCARVMPCGTRICANSRTASFNPCARVMPCGERNTMHMIFFCFNPCARVMPCGERDNDLHRNIRFNPCARVMPCGKRRNGDRCSRIVSTRARASCLAADSDWPSRNFNRFNPCARVMPCGKIPSPIDPDRLRFNPCARVMPCGTNGVMTGKTVCFNPCARVMPCGISGRWVTSLNQFQPVRARHALRHAHPPRTNVP